MYVITPTILFKGEIVQIITLCMGSSCFSRSNNINADIIDRFIHDRNLTTQVMVQGSLCTGHCKSGPVIIIDGELHNQVEPGMLLDLLEHKLCKAQP